jgi:hypothetical protein
VVRDTRARRRGMHVVWANQAGSIGTGHMDSRAFAAAIEAISGRHITTRPYRSQTKQRRPDRSPRRPAQGERQNPFAARVYPLNIVNCEKHWPLRGHDSEHINDEAEGTGAGRARRPGLSQGDRPGRTAGPGSRAPPVGRQYGVAVIHGVGDGVGPQRRLADAGLALDDKR